MPTELERWDEHYHIFAFLAWCAEHHIRLAEGTAFHITNLSDEEVREVLYRYFATRSEGNQQ